jgi:hypothetical protein
MLELGKMFARGRLPGILESEAHGELKLSRSTGAHRICVQKRRDSTEAGRGGGRIGTEIARRVGVDGAIEQIEDFRAKI